VAFVRFSRDRRGYENTFLLHAGRSRGEKERPRLLYWFRTPPHLKVGRTPFDDDVIRLLEDQHPDVEFDWARLLEAAAPASPDWNGQAVAAADVTPPPPDPSHPGPGDTLLRSPNRSRRRGGRVTGT
jgi:hypothetical protein